MQTIKASEFKARCLTLLDEVARTGKPLLITRHGKPLAELHPHPLAKAPALGILKAELRITGDIVTPLDADWNAPK